MRVVPISELEPGHWTVPDAFLAHCWERIVESGRVPEVFWDGGLATEEGFQTLMHTPGIYPVAVLRGEEPVFLAWLSSSPDAGWMRAHFCALGLYVRGSAEEVLRFWSRLPLVGLLGIIPEVNRAALRLVRGLGWAEVGRIARFCAVERLQQRVAGVLFTYLIEEA